MKRELLKDKDILFAGYKMPHPLEHKIEVKIQTTGKNPTKALETAVAGLQDELIAIRRQFQV